MVAARSFSEYPGAAPRNGTWLAGAVNRLPPPGRDPRAAFVICARLALHRTRDGKP